jgi:transposase-like protein
MQKTNNSRQNRKGKGGRSFQYSHAFMRKVVADYLSGSQSMAEVAARYSVKANQIGHWKSLFSSELEQRTILPTVMTEEEQKELDALKKQNEALLKKLEYANLQVFGLQTMIDIAEEQFKIEIRKKPGTKPSTK